MRKCKGPRVSKGGTLKAGFRLPRLLTRGLLHCMLVLAATLAVFAQDRQRTAAPKPRTAEQEVRIVIARWATAVKDRDTDALSSLFADDLFITVDGGSTRGKREELDILKPSTTTRTVSVTNENVRVNTFPRSNVAVVTAIVRMIFRTSGRDSPFAMRYTSLWEKRGGRWQLTVLHTSRLATR